MIATARSSGVEFSWFGCRGGCHGNSFAERKARPAGMVHLEGESLNSLFDALATWNAHLEPLTHELRELVDDE